MPFTKILIYTFITLSSSICCGAELIKHKQHNIITLFGGIGSRENIHLLLKKKKLIPPNSNFIGVGYRSTIMASTPFYLNVEGIKHFGKQTSMELTLYPSIETSTLKLGKIGLSWNIGDGLSAMVGSYPKFEKYATIKSQRVLNLLVLEQNIFLQNKPQLQLKLRWHHRCHLFGILAPKGSGSNFVALGIGYQI